MTERWIEIPGWDKFQHYRDRGPKWIKEYVEQLDKDEYMNLSLTQRGLLISLRLLYARRAGVVSGNTSTLSRQLNDRVTTAQLEALNHSGFIRFVASRPVPNRYGHASPETEKRHKELEDLGITAKPTPSYSRPPEAIPGAAGTRSRTPKGHPCPHCGILKSGPNALQDHIDLVHYDQPPPDPPPDRSKLEGGDAQ